MLALVFDNKVYIFNFENCPAPGAQRLVDWYPSPLR
jgi:hypothetical protein